MNRILITLFILLINLDLALAESNMTGLFRFSQYVSLEEGEKEAKAIEGLIYISESVFSEKEKSAILGKKLIFEGTLKAQAFHDDKLSVCVATKPLIDSKHSILASSKQITRARSRDNTTLFVVRKWADWSYAFVIEDNSSTLKLTSQGGKRGFGFFTERFEINKIENAGLQACLEYDDELDKSLRRSNKKSVVDAKDAQHN